MSLSSASRAAFSRQPVLCIASLFAIVTTFFVPPDERYFDYVDWRVIGLLFCLMVVVMGFRRLGGVDALSSALIRALHDMRRLTLGLVIMAFFTSMLLTNDVALISLVPLTMSILSCSGRLSDAARLVTLEAIAANLGSMATPLGNPQNLFLYTAFHLPASEFFSAMVPLSVISLILLMVAAFLSPKHEIGVQSSSRYEPAVEPMRWRAVVVGVLFVLAIFAVFRLLPVPYLIAAILLGFGVADWRALIKIDYGLLATFVVFFIFVGNLQRIGAVNELMTSFASDHALSGGFCLSQVISNVPAAILLSGFTRDASGLLVGVNIGGLGTLVASLASLIAFQGYAKVCHDQKARFIGVFTFYNVVFAAILLLFQSLVLS